MITVEVKLRIAVLVPQELQHIINQGKQMFSGNLHLFAVLLHQFFIMMMSFIDFNHPHNAIKRCPHIMTHAVEKLRFSLVSQLCLLPSCFQLLLSFFFNFLASDSIHLGLTTLTE